MNQLLQGLHSRRLWLRVKLSTLNYIWFAYLAWASSCEISEDTARQRAGGTGRDSSRQDVHSSHRSQKAMLQPCVHHHRREASIFESSRPASEAPLSLWQSCDLFPTSGVALGYVRAAAKCQNVVLFVSVDSVHGFTQRALLWSEMWCEMTGVTRTGPAWLCSTRWPRLGGKRPIKTGHTLFITNTVESWSPQRVHPCLRLRVTVRL